MPPVPLYRGIPDDRDAFWKELSNTYGEVAPVLLEPEVPAWLLLSYEANFKVMSDNNTFVCDRRYWRDLETGVIPPDSAVRAINEKRESVLYTDGEKHQFLSRGMHNAFASLNEQRVMGEIRQVAEGLVDQFCERGSADLIGEYARLLPLYVLGRLLGLEQSGVKELAEAMRKLWGGGSESPQGATELKRLLTQLSRERRTKPANDLPSHLIANGHSDNQVCDQLTLIIASTNDLVTNTIGTALRRLLMDSWLAAEHAQSQLLVSETINYIMLQATPIEVVVGRFPTHNVNIGGYRIRAGDCLVLGFAAANADLLRRTPPEAATYTRAHLTYGAGPHRCPRYGRDLGQAMAEIALTTITQRLPDLRLAESPEQHRWIPHINVRGLVDLPVRFTPDRSGARTQHLDHWHSRPKDYRQLTATRSANMSPPSKTSTPWWRRPFTSHKKSKD